MNLENIIKHARDREYMSGIERDHVRVKATGEVFTPAELVQEVLDKMDQSLFADPDKTFLDNCCGDGQFLSEVLIRKVQNGINFETALSTIYGVDIMPDNVAETRQRLIDIAGDTPENWKIVNSNILCKDGLTYDYSFGDSPAEKLFAW
jgi:type I restriction-modification system DNA methylase subunit